MLSTIFFVRVIPSATMFITFSRMMTMFVVFLLSISVTATATTAAAVLPLVPVPMLVFLPSSTIIRRFTGSGSASLKTTAPAATTATVTTWTRAAGEAALIII